MENDKRPELVREIVREFGEIDDEWRRISEEALASQRAGVRTLQKWDYEQRRYLPLTVPEGWNCKTIYDDMGERVNCPHCGRELPFGLTYASLEVHTAMGMGYGVCEECHKAEVERKMRARDEGDG